MGSLTLCSSTPACHEGHLPCTSAPGPGTPARSSHTASGSAACIPHGTHLHGQKQNMSAAFPEGRGEIRKRSFPFAKGGNFSPAKYLDNKDNLGEISGPNSDQGLDSPSLQSS